MRKNGKLRYLGYDKETVKRCRPYMDEDNLKTLRTVCRLLFFMLAGLTAFYVAFDNNWVRNGICAASALVLLGLHRSARSMLKKPETRSSARVDALIYILSVLCFSVAIYMGTFAMADNMAVPPIWMFFFAVQIFNRLPVQNFIVLTLSFLAFVVCSYVTKEPYIFGYDVMHASTSAIASIFMAWSKSRLKMENILAIEQMQNEHMAIQEAVEVQEKEAALLRHRASRDEMTGLYKKISFEQKVQEYIDTSDDESMHALICLDVDNFKNINDSFGHLFGDDVLKEIVAGIRAELCSEDLAGRFGGDEFLLFIPSVSDLGYLARTISRIIANCQKTYIVGGVTQRISLSAGISLFPTDSTSYETLLHKADSALYHAKRAGKGDYCFYSDQLQQEK